MRAYKVDTVMVRDRKDRMGNIRIADITCMG